MIALVADGTLNYLSKLINILTNQQEFFTSSAANFNTAVKGAFSGTLILNLHVKSINY